MTRDPRSADPMPNAFRAGQGNLSPAEEAMVARRDRVLGPAYRLFYETPVHLVRGEGVWLYDADGNAYLDAYNNVASVGHCHPHVIAATARQAAELATRHILSFGHRTVATVAGFARSRATCAIVSVVTRLALAVYWAACARCVV